MLKNYTVKFLLRNISVCNNHPNSLARVLHHKNRNYTTSVNQDEEKEREILRIKSNASLDEPPTACCGSGCANCVFVIWAETLAEKMENAGPEIAEKIMKMVDDPSMRAYLELELRLRGLKK